MNKNKMSLLIFPVAVLSVLSLVSLAYADNRPNNQNFQNRGNGPRGNMSSTSRQFATGTRPMGINNRFGSSTLERGGTVINGNVSSIENSTLTVTDKKGIVYSVDISSAVLKKNKGEDMSISDIKVSDAVIVQGNATDTSSTTIKALRVSDITLSRGDKATTTKSVGFFGKIGNFFKKMFGR